MIDYYSKYYLNDSYIKNMLTDAIIVFDTSALLDLYYYSATTRDEINDKVFNYFSNRLWIPAQAYFEFLKNKEKVSRKPIGTYKSLITKTDGTGGYINKINDAVKSITDTEIKKIQNQLKTLKEQTIKDDKHPHIDKSIYQQYDSELLEFITQIESFKNKTDIFSAEFSNKIDQTIKNLETEILEDSVRQMVESNFQIGKEYNYQKMYEISKEGEYRYGQDIPPGYRDSEKEGLQKYGDLFFWNQILDYVRKKRKDILLVSNDVKPDWYDSELNAPRFELLKEFNLQSNNIFWMCTMKDFLWQVNTLLDSKVSDEMIEEVTAIQTERQEVEFVPQSDDLLNMIQEVFDCELQEKVYLMQEIPDNEALRVFNNPLIYEAEDESGKKIRVITTKISGGNYARMLHGMTNAFEIKKFYNINRELYLYYNFIILTNASLIPKAMENLQKTKTKKLFGNKSIRTILCYTENNKLFMVKTNYTSDIV